MPSLSEAWSLLTRLGEAQILLPVMLVALGGLWMRAATRPLALRWAGATLLAVLITTASKLAFMGWGLGSAALDFTGLSGHAVFAAALLPVLARLAAGPAPTTRSQVLLAAGVGLAALVALSRVITGAHSASEALLGLLAGGAAAAFTLGALPTVTAAAAAAPARPSPWLAALLAGWLLLLPFTAPPARTHEWVQALSLALSGRTQTHTRHELHRRPALPPDGHAPAAWAPLAPVGLR